MPRKPVVRSNEHFYHLTGRSNNKEHFYLGSEQVWEIMVKQLSCLQKEYDLQISAFVLMGNHFHLLALTPNEPIEKIMYSFMKDVTKKMQKRTGRINKIFGGRYKGCLIEDSKYLLNVYKYVYRNPVAAGVVDRAEEYPYSTLQNKSSLTLSKIMPMNIAVNSSVELDWINFSFEEREVESMKWGLTRSKFQYMKSGSRRKPVSPRDLLNTG